MRFAKGHGTGNDFVVVPDADGLLDLTASLVRSLCDRHSGIGADGVLRVVRTAAAGADGAGMDAALWFMDYRNADGSIAQMCGNGIRVFAQYLIGLGLATGPELAIATRSGIRLVRREAAGQFTVDMGPATPGGAGWAMIGGRRYTGLSVCVGNPHLVCLVDEPVRDLDLSTPPTVDPAAFPDGVNVEVVRVTEARAIEMRVHERGSGETMSCGTGAVAASVAAAMAAGRYPADGGDARWAVEVPGGRLTVTPSATRSLLTGPAVIVAEGEISPSWLDDFPISSRTPRASARA